MERVLAKHGRLSSLEAEALKHISISLTNKFLHAPTTELKRIAEAGEGDEFVWIVKRLFRLDDPR